MPDNRLLEPALEIGSVSNIEPWRVKVNLHQAGKISSTFFRGKRYGLGEVGEFVLIESETNVILGRILECRLPERERLSVDQSIHDDNVNPIGIVQLLGTYDQLTEKLKAGVRQYPRLGSRVYSAPHKFLSLIPMKLDSEEKAVTLNLGHIKGASETPVNVIPERIFGRHCAVLGATGGGKSWSIAKIISECIRYNAKVILLDATGEYRTLKDRAVSHVEILGNQQDDHESDVFTIPYTQLTEGDFVALFQPAGKVQGPKLREAIRSLRLIKIKPELTSNGLLVKCKKAKRIVSDAMNEPSVKRCIENPSSEFDVNRLSEQIHEECVWENNADFSSGRKVDKPTEWGDYYDGDYSYCLSLVNRINAILHSPELKCFFEDGLDLFTKTNECLNSNDYKILRISLEYLSFSFNAREIIANAIGRWFLEQARHYRFRKQPIIIILDEAHQFINKHIGSEDSLVRLDAFELLAKEGRKYGLNICLATQRPRDLPEGILSQMGTLIVHRLTNDRDREIVERACGEIDRSASYFLPSLEPGEAALIGVDFPIPLTIQMGMPPDPPESTGPDYQQHWGDNQEVVSEPVVAESPPRPARRRRRQENN